MKNAIKLFLVFTIVVSLAEYAIVYKDSFSVIYNNATDAIAGVFFTPSITEAQLHNTFAEVAKTSRKVRVLLVPGHEPTWGGTEFNSAVERDIVVNIGKEIADQFSNESNYAVTVARDRAQWQPYLSNYFISERDVILSWKNKKEEEMNRLIEKGFVRQVIGAYHVNAPDDTAIHLYGINKWTSENNIDIVIHLHINDYPRRNSYIAGEYDGGTIYIPEGQYSNAGAANGLAKSIAEKLLRILPKSNLPEESAGIVPDQELIAIGSFNTSDSASILIEYGYIYEPMYRTKETRDFIEKEFAYQTAQGIKDYFEKEAKIKDKYEGERATLPYTWTNKITEKTKLPRDILALQIALASTGLYYEKNDPDSKCPLTGFFGPCTKFALSNLQKKLGINEEGVFGEETRVIFNRLFGPQGDGVVRTEEAYKSF